MKQGGYILREVDALIRVLLNDRSDKGISFCFLWKPELQGLKLPEPAVGGDVARSIHKQPPLLLGSALLSRDLNYRAKVSGSLFGRRKEK